MNRQCIDPETGALLHAWEIGALSEEDSKRFETHLLGCRDCFRKAQEFSPRAAILRHDDSVRNLVHETNDGSESALTVMDKLKHCLWPDLPLLIRPALTLLVIALLIYPSWLGLRSVRSPEVKPIECVDLVNSRGIEVQEVQLDQDLALKFVHNMGHAGMPYEVKIVDDKGRVAVQYRAPSCLNEYGTGMLLLERGSLQPGVHTLVVTVPGSDPVTGYVEYKFRVLPLN
jgi:hypothetical protein